MDKSYLEAVERKLIKQGKSEDEILREMNKILGIQEPTVIKIKKDAGSKSGKGSARLTGGETVEEVLGGKDA
jgi:hypothetical protein